MMQKAVTLRVTFHFVVRGLPNLHLSAIEELPFFAFQSLTPLPMGWPKIVAVFPRRMWYGRS
jgi:hypothetical protein